MIKFGVINEGKVPSDERVALTPAQVIDLKIIGGEQVDFNIQTSAVRRIKDSEYQSANLSVVENVENCDVLIGVKEVPISNLIPNKTYLFFSHTIKKQPYNKPLLKAILDKNITLIDWECLRDENDHRLIGFGRYAGIVGSYNGFRALGKLHGNYELKKATDCVDRVELNLELAKISLSPIKILLTGAGKVAKGALEVLTEIGIRKVEINEYLAQSFDEAVYCQIDFHDYFRKEDNNEFTTQEFMAKPSLFKSDFMKFARVTDFLITGHFWSSQSPFLFTREDAKSADFNIKLVADISCDIDGPIASTLRPSTIAHPFYGYDPILEKEVPFGTKDSIAVMAVDNLPCELPRDASNDFGEMFTKFVFPAFLNGDEKTILKRATIAENGAVTDEFAYLRSWVEE
jgi:saccharopine dehydrogenase (NAD+, L-lysine forming)